MGCLNTFSSNCLQIGTSPLDWYNTDMKMISLKSHNGSMGYATAFLVTQLVFKKKGEKVLNKKSEVGWKV